MIYLKEHINILPKRIPYLGIDDEIINGEDVALMDTLRNVINLQRKIALRLTMKIIEPTSYDMFNMNEIIRIINDNFIELEDKINKSIGDSRMLNFDEFKESLIYFNEQNKSVSIKIEDNKVNLKTETKTYKYDVADDIMEIVDE
jgi:hypothetical protein